MWESLLVPDTVGIEYEHFFGFHVAEDHVLVKHVDAPEDFARDNISINLLKVLYVNDNSADSTEHVCLVEHNLLSVREQLSVEGEKANVSIDTGEAEAGDDEGHQ